MLPELVDPAVYSDMICEDMKRGLAGENSFMPMIPTYLVNDGAVPKNDPVIVIDAGGTNFRCGLLRFSESEETDDDLINHNEGQKETAYGCHRLQEQLYNSHLRSPPHTGHPPCPHTNTQRAY